MCIELIKGICIDTQVLIAIGILIIAILAYKLLKI